MTVSTWAEAFTADLNALACDRTWPATDSREDTYAQHRCGTVGPHDQCVCQYQHQTPQLRPTGRWGR